MANFNEAKKRQILEATRNSTKVAVAKRFGVSLQTLRNWEKSLQRAVKEVPHPEPRVHYTEADSRELQKAREDVADLERLVIRLVEKLASNGLL